MSSREEGVMVVRFARMCVLGLAAVSTVALTGCASSGSGYPTRTRCAGEVCIQVTRSGLTVSDVIGYFAPAGTSVSDRTWRLALTSYDCDPGSHHPSRCLPTGSYPGPARHGDPPAKATCTSNKSVPGGQATPASCLGHLAEELATHGDWSGFFEFAQGRGGHTFIRATWLCVAAQLLADGGWQDETTPSSSVPVRACSEVVQ
jgi:hypothetical protein